MSAETEKIQGRYNGDFDIIQGGPLVTWAEYELAMAVERLEKEVKALRSIVDELKKKRK